MAAAVVAALDFRDDVSVQLFVPSPPRLRTMTGTAKTSTAPGPLPLKDVTNTNLSARGNANDRACKLPTSLPASVMRQTMPSPQPSLALPVNHSAVSIDVTPVKRPTTDAPWFPSGVSPIDTCTLVMLSSAPRPTAVATPERCSGLEVDRCPQAESPSPAVRAADVVKASIGSISPVPIRTLPRRQHETRPVSGVNTTPRRGLDSASTCYTKFESPSLLKQRHMHQLVRGPLFDTGAVAEVIATPSRMAALGRSPTPGMVVMFGGVPAVVGDADKLRFTPRPPSSRATHPQSAAVEGE